MLWLGAGEGSILRGPPQASQETQAIIREQWLPCSLPPSSPQRLGGPEIMSWGHQESSDEIHRGPPSGEGPALSALVNFPVRGSLVILLICFWPRASEFDTFRGFLSKWWGRAR